MSRVDDAPRAVHRAAPTSARDPHGGSADVAGARGAHITAGVGVRTPTPAATGVARWAIGPLCAPGPASAVWAAGRRALMPSPARRFAPIR